MIMIIICFVMIITIIMMMIRSVLSRAELEALPLDNNLKEDVAKGKVILMMMMVILLVMIMMIMTTHCNADDDDGDIGDIVSNQRSCEKLLEKLLEPKFRSTSSVI